MPKIIAVICGIPLRGRPTVCKNNRLTFSLYKASSDTLQDGDTMLNVLLVSLHVGKITHKSVTVHASQYRTCR